MFCIGEERVEEPNGVEDQTDLDKIETLKGCQFEGADMMTKSYCVGPVLG